VLEVRERLHRLGIELQQHRAKPADGLVQRPDRLLVLPGKRLDRQPFIADRWQRPVAVPIGAQDVREDERVARVGLLARLAVPLPIARHRPRVDRVDRQTGGL
jgi:hypothetical protein